MRKKKDNAALKWILQIAGSSLWWTALLTGIRILQGVTCLLYARGLQEVVDSATAGVGDAFYRRLGMFAALVVLTLALQCAGRYVSEKGKVAMEKRFRLHTFSQLLCRDYAQVTHIHTGEWMSRITADTSIVVGAAATIFPELTGALVRMLGALIALLQIMPRLAYILVPGGLLLAIFSVFVRKPLKSMHKSVRRADGTVRSFMQERLYSLLVVRVFTQEDASRQAAEAYTDQYSGARMRRFHFSNLCNTVLGISINAAQVLGIGLCGWGILHGVMSYGTMSSVLYLINVLETPIATISGYFSQYFSMLASAERLMEIENFESDSPDAAIAQGQIQQYYAEQFRSLGLQNAEFSYDDGDGNTVLKDFSLDVPKGAFVAFTGQSGCGKSTALKVLLSLYPLKAGRAYLRNADGTEQPLDATWRGLFAYVPQGNQLISGTIRETLTFGDPKLMTCEDQIWTALKIACADAFVKELPNSLDTLLGERGSGLSEGQIQRLCVARAVLSGRPVLLLDEATSALDADTEQQMLQNLRAMTDRTVLIISHREATMAYCDHQIRFGQ